MTTSSFEQTIFNLAAIGRLLCLKTAASFWTWPAPCELREGGAVREVLFTLLPWLWWCRGQQGPKRLWRGDHLCLWGVKSAQVGNCARAALPRAAATGEPQSHVARGTWQKMFASSYMKWNQAGLPSCLPLALYKEVESLWGYSRTPRNWDWRNYMVIMNP